MEISRIMTDDHTRIINLLYEFSTLVEESGESKESLLKVCQQFKWELERHFLTEEKEVCTRFPENGDQEMLQKMKDDHTEILNILVGMEGKISNEEETSCLELKTSLLSHQNFEDNYFYPYLEENLNEEQKQEMKDKVSHLLTV